MPSRIGPEKGQMAHFLTHGEGRSCAGSEPGAWGSVITRETCSGVSHTPP